MLITSHPRWPSRRVEEGLPVLRLPRPPQRPLLRAGFEDSLTHVPLSYAALRAGSYDIAHAMYQSDGLAAARWRAPGNLSVRIFRDKRCRFQRSDGGAEVDPSDSPCPGKA